MKQVHTVRHDAAARRFEIVVDQSSCELVYVLHGSTMTIHHTGVPSQLEGQGLAAQLAQAALAHARAQGWRVQPSCSYVRAYMQRHPESLDLLAT
jgi:uncharacterized protein